MKAAVIGRGFGANVMAPAYEALGFEVEIVPSRDSQAVARACSGPVDLVSIHSPPFQHREHVMAALAQGRDVLCDKPFGKNAAEARAMRDAARKAGVLHFLNYEFRCQPARAKAMELIAQGKIGKLTHVSWTSHGNGMRGRPHGWLYDADLGGGWIGALGSHLIDALICFFGCGVASCGGMLRTEIPDRPDSAGKRVRSTAEDSFSAWFVMEDGGTASLDTGYSAAVNLPPTVHLLGSEGAITIARESVVTLTPASRGKAESFDLSPRPGDPPFPAIPLWLAKLAEALRERRQIAPSFEDGVAAAEVMDRLRASAVRAAAAPAPRDR